jgi:hypothetical protein
MSDPQKPELNADGHVQPAYLIPLWTWLAVLTISIAFFFHGASQGAPWQVDFGFKLADESKVKDQLAGLWGVPFLGLSALALYQLTLTWMQRLYTQPPQSRWDWLPAPVFWHFPSKDPVTRKLRLVVWILLLGGVPFSLGHLTLKHFQLTFYEQCAEPLKPACTLMPKGPAPPAGSADGRKSAHFIEFSHEDKWQRFLLHIAPQHLRTPGYFDHRFHIGAPSHLTYFPGLQPWIYIGLVLWVYWLWLHILLSVYLGRVVLGDLGTSLRRLASGDRLSSPNHPNKARVRFPPLFRWLDATVRLFAQPPTISNNTTEKPAPISPPALRIGFIGHRSLSPEAAAHVESAFLTAWTIARAARPDYPARLVCGLADGADHLAARMVLEELDPQFTAALSSTDPHRIEFARMVRLAQYDLLRETAKVELLVLIPSEISAFRTHSGLMDMGSFDALLNAASANPSADVLVLPGVFREQPASSDPKVMASLRQERIAAHRFKTEVLVRQCEFLVAAINLADPGKPGGTRECVELALALGTPVLGIDIETGHCAMVTGHQQLIPDGLNDPDWKEKWSKSFNFLWPLEPQTTIPAALSSRLRRIYSGALRSGLAPFAPAWKGFLQWLDKPESSTKSPPGTMTPLEQMRSRIASDQRNMMGAYRGSYIVSYGLGLLAVTLALLILLLLAMWGTHAPVVALVTVLTLLKLVVVKKIVQIIHLGEHEHPADTATALRYVVERLRIMPAMLKLGCARLDLLHQTQRMGIPALLAEDLCRRVSISEILSFNPRSALQDLQKLLSEQQRHHADDHRRHQHRFEAQEQLLQECSRWIVRIIWADISILAIKLSIATGLAPAALLPFKGLISAIGLVLVVCTALLPAIMATINAILFQSQFEQLAERAKHMSETLTDLHNDANKLHIELQTSGSFDASRILALAEKCAAVLAEEVAEWAMMSKQKLRDS